MNVTIHAVANRLHQPGPDPVAAELDRPDASFGQSPRPPQPRQRSDRRPPGRQVHSAGVPVRERLDRPPCLDRPVLGGATDGPTPAPGLGGAAGDRYCRGRGEGKEPQEARPGRHRPGWGLARAAIILAAIRPRGDRAARAPTLGPSLYTFPSKLMP